MDADTNHIAKCYTDPVLTNVCHCQDKYTSCTLVVCRLCTFLLLQISKIIPRIIIIRSMSTPLF